MATTTRTSGTSQSNETLSALIQQLLNGGTQDMQRQQAARQGEINANQALRARYSPEAALADSQGLISQTLQQAMERALPSITRSAEGAGASGNALRALLTQDALTRASQASSAVGVGAVQGYGGIGAQLSGVLENLTRSDNSGMDALLQALQLMQESTQVTETDGGIGGGSSGGGTRRPGGSYGETGMPNTNDFFNRPGGILSNAALQRATPPQVFGPALSDAQILDTIQQGLRPSQSVRDVANINTLFTDRYQF